MNLKTIYYPNLFLTYLQIAKRYVDKENNSDEMIASIIIYIFSVCAAETTANDEIWSRSLTSLNNNNYKEIMGGNSLYDSWKNLGSNGLDELIRNESLYEKWKMLLYGVGIKPREKEGQELLTSLSEIIEIRNELIHFKSHKNVEIHTPPPAGKVTRPDGNIYQTYDQENPEIEKTGVYHKKLNMKEAKSSFEAISNLIYKYYDKQKRWPCSEEDKKEVFDWMEQ